MKLKGKERAVLVVAIESALYSRFNVDETDLATGARIGGTANTIADVFEAFLWAKKKLKKDKWRCVK